MKTYTIIIAIIFAGMFTSCKKSTLSPDRCDKHITATEDDTDDINNTARRSDGRQVRIGDEERPNRHERSSTQQVQTVSQWIHSHYAVSSQSVHSQSPQAVSSAATHAAQSSPSTTQSPRCLSRPHSYHRHSCCLLLALVILALC